MDNPNQNRGPWCAGCGTEKRAGNNWFLIRATEREFASATIGTEGFDGAPYEPGCAARRYSEWLGERIQEMTTRRDDQADGVK